jgi:hypothetical protein
LAAIARIDDNGIFCRWPNENRKFLQLLTTASAQYRETDSAAPLGSVSFRLSDLRSALMGPNADGDGIAVRICPSCVALAVGPHDCDNVKLELRRWPVDIPEMWFLDFLAEAGNQLDPALRVALAAAELEERTRRGAFGIPYRRRWLRYRDARVRQRLIAALGDAVRTLRQSGSDFDVTFDVGSARVTWHRAARGFKP